MVRHNQHWILPLLKHLVVCFDLLFVGQDILIMVAVLCGGRALQLVLMTVFIFIIDFLDAVVLLVVWVWTTILSLRFLKAIY